MHCKVKFKWNGDKKYISDWKNKKMDGEINFNKKRNNKEEKIKKIKDNCEYEFKKIFEKDEIKKILNKLGN